MQNFIRESVSPMNLRFVSVKSLFDRFCLNRKQSSYNKHIETCPGNVRSSSVSCGYKTMCYFWYIGFIEHVSMYKYVLRVDDDCILDRDQPDPLSIVDDVDFAAALLVKKMDSPALMVGMIDTLNRSTYEFTDKFPTQLINGRGWNHNGWSSSPYTNLMWVNLSYAKSAFVQKIQADVAKTGCIHANRWGDAPLWGGTLNVTSARVGHLNITYRHKSHYFHVGYDTYGVARTK